MIVCIFTMLLVVVSLLNHDPRLPPCVLHMNVNRFLGIQETKRTCYKLQRLELGIVSCTGLGKATCCGTFSAGQQDSDCVGLFVCFAAARTLKELAGLVVQNQGS